MKKLNLISFDNNLILICNLTLQNESIKGTFAMFKNNQKHIELGKLGEDIAVHYLTKKGYKIYDRNVKNRIGELDIIAIDGNTLVFVEVKTREGADFGLPYEAIDYRKQQKIKNTAIAFLKYKNLYEKVDIRFDCVSVLSEYDTYKIDHLQNIF